MKKGNSLSRFVSKAALSSSVAVLTLATVFTLSTANAYDTDIYYSAEEGNPVNHPNVVFVLDTSGSMNARDGTSTSRMTKLKAAMTTVLQGTTDVNVGMIRFGITNLNNLPQSDHHMPMAYQIAPISSINGAGVRDSLIGTVNALPASGGTPLVDGLWEAGMMITGGTVRNSEGGTQVISTNTTTNPITGAIETQEVFGPTPLVNYPDPMLGECQPNHIILLSDGDATKTNVTQLVPDELGLSCSEGGARACGTELASWLQNTNHAPGFVTPKNVTVHTVGFRTNNTFLPSLSNVGGGDHYSADNGQELVDAFQAILTTVKDSDAAFTQPSTSIDQANRLSQSSDLIFALFKPQPNATWNGNLKKYQLGLHNGNITVLDASGSPAFDASTGGFANSARDGFGNMNDGNNVELGGVASRMQLGRKIYTHIGGIPNGGQTLSTQLNSGAVSSAMLGVDTNTRTDLLSWIDGRDIKDEDDDENRTEGRQHLGDIIHSTPVSVNYAGGRSTVFVGTNEGFLHGFDMGSGDELFAYIPEELIPNLKKFYNSVGAYLRPFGLDGEISLKHDDINNNGIVDGSEQAIIYVGMRRGGRNYYAIDVTYRDSPRILWKIEGGSGDFSRLGQTWSKPVPTKIMFQGNERDVVIFGGGYDINQDPVDRRNDSPRSSTDSMGNSLYIVDALTGAHIWSADQNLGVSGMNFSIPANLRVIDVNGDSYADRIYVGDMGGQVWRFDIMGYHQSGGASSLVKGGIMATLGSRRFYNEPDVALMSDKGQRFMSISIGSGWRANPTHTGTANRFYMVRDNNPLNVPDGYGKQNGNVWDPITESDLPNVTNSVSTSSGNDPDPDGWMIDLKDNGEKSLSRSTTINNQVLFTTYTPIAAPDPCSPPSGRTHIYALNAVTGDPALALSSGGSGVGTDPSDRRRSMSTENIPPAPSGAIVEVGGQIHTGVIAGTETPINNLPFSDLTKRTYWQDNKRGSMTPATCRQDSNRAAICR